MNGAAYVAAQGTVTSEIDSSDTLYDKTLWLAIWLNSLFLWIMDIL